MHLDPILIGHNGSAEAERALLWAGSLASSLGGSLVVAHAYSVGDQPGGPDSAAAAAELRVKEWAVGAESAGLPADRLGNVVLSGPVGPAVVEAAETTGAGLVVLGAHHGLVPVAAVGRITQHVTFRSPCPVAVVHAGGGPVATAPIVVGFDAANPHLDIVAWSSALAGRLDVDLEAVCVGRLREPVEEDVFAELDADVGPVPPLHVRDGDPGAELLARAAELEASMIVVGQRRDQNLGGRVLGRTAASLLRKSDRPVVVFHHP